MRDIPKELSIEETETQTKTKKEIKEETGLKDRDSESDR